MQFRTMSSAHFFCRASTDRLLNQVLDPDAHHDRELSDTLKEDWEWRNSKFPL